MNIIFDLDDTLYDIVDSFEKALKEMIPALKDHDKHELYKEFRVHSDALFEFSQKSDENLKIMQKERIKRTVLTYGYAISDEKAETFHKRYAYLQYNTVLKNHVKELLEGLIKEGHCLGLMTNGNSIHQRAKIEGLGIEDYFKDAIIVSGDHGYDKPDERIFKVMEEKMGEGSYIMVGDSFDNDIVGAINSGWDAIWINKNNVKMPRDYDIKVISDLEDLRIEDFDI